MTQQAGGSPNPKAVEHCATAIKKFSTLPVERVKEITAEISMLGRSGLDMHNPAEQYALNSLPGSYTGLELVCYLYVGIQMFSPGTDVGFDLGAEYNIAKVR